MLNTVNVSALKNAGITDLFISTSKQNVEGTLVPFLNTFSGSGIRIHAWIGCFINDGSWYDPGTNPTLVNQLLKSIISISTNYKIDGIHLDTTRYPGTAYKYNGTTHVTSFVKNVYNAIGNINNQEISGKPQILLSAALMPECGGNAYYYGQDYGQLAPYLDFMVPMIYKGNYLADTDWIGSTTKYIVEHAGGTPVVAGLQTYRSDSYAVPIPISELNLDKSAATSNGSSGYVLFKYGLTDTTVSGIPYFTTTEKAEIVTAAGAVKRYIEKYEKLPSKTTVGSFQVDMPTFLYLLSKSCGNTNIIRLIDYNNPTNPSETVNSGTLLKTEYLSIASTILNYMTSKGSAPNYVNSSIGTLPYKNLIYAYSKIMNFYDVNDALPSSVSIKPLSWPKISSTNPASNATKVSRITPIIITFNGNIYTGTNYSGIYVKNTNSGSKISITKTISGNTLTIKTSTRLYNTTYQVYIPEGALKNKYGNSLVNAYTYRFTTIPKDTTPPTVAKTKPTNKATGFSLTAPITVTFSESVKAGTSYSAIYIKNLTTGKTVSISSKSISGNVLTIKMKYSRLSRNTYQVYLPAKAVKDASGNYLVSSYKFQFKTV